MHALLWSGGKDCSLALHRARAAGLEVARLVSFVDPDREAVRFHGTPRALLAAQAEAAGLELLAVRSGWAELDAAVRAAFITLAEAGFEGVVSGDVHLAEVRAWYEERARDAGLDYTVPLWGDDPAALVEEFVAAGGRAVLTCVESSRLGPEWLGREIGPGFAEAARAAGIDPCGEHGEYHSFTHTGPWFAHPVAWRRGDVVDREPGFAQLEVSAA